MFLVLMFLLFLVVLSAAIYVLALFFQGYIYTQPVGGLAWRAPAAAGVMSVFYTIWCAIVLGSDSSPGSIPYDTIFRFSPEVALLKSPAKKLTAIYADGTKVELKTGYNDNRPVYVELSGRPYNPSRVVAFEMTHDNAVMYFKKVRRDDTDNRMFVTDDGWGMEEFTGGPTGIPYQSRWGRFFANLFLNVVHGALWFLCLWLLLEFRFNEALGFSIVVWLAATLALPVALDAAATRARDAAVRSPAAS